MAPGYSSGSFISVLWIFWTMIVRIRPWITQTKFETVGMWSDGPCQIVLEMAWSRMAWEGVIGSKQIISFSIAPRLEAAILIWMVVSAGGPLVGLKQLFFMSGCCLVWSSPGLSARCLDRACLRPWSTIFSFCLQIRCIIYWTTYFIWQIFKLFYFFHDFVI